MEKTSNQNLRSCKIRCNDIRISLHLMYDDSNVNVERNLKSNAIKRQRHLLIPKIALSYHIICKDINANGSHGLFKDYFKIKAMNSMNYSLRTLFLPLLTQNYWSLEVFCKENEKALV